MEPVIISDVEGLDIRRLLNLYDIIFKKSFTTVLSTEKQVKESILKAIINNEPIKSEGGPDMII